MQLKLTLLIVAILTSSSATPTTIFAEDLLEISAKTWQEFEQYEKYVYVAGFVGGMYAVTWVLKADGTINEDVEADVTAQRNVTLVDVCRNVDAFYAQGGRNYSVPLYAVVHEYLRKKFYSYK